MDSLRWYERLEWRWWLRRECRRLVDVADLIEDGERVGITVLVCGRRRFHPGRCRASD